MSSEVSKERESLTDSNRGFYFSIFRYISQIIEAANSIVSTSTCTQNTATVYYELFEQSALLKSVLS